MAIQPEIVITIISAVATLFGAVASVSAKSFAGRTIWVRAKGPSNAASIDLLTKRIFETRQELVRQQQLVRIHRLAGWLLTFGQFVIGGLLASSFVQQSLSKELIGGLGLLVLVSSLLRQHYQPEVEAGAARRRVAKLKNVLREVEDNIELQQENNTSALTSGQLRMLLRQALAETESPDAIVAQQRTTSAIATTSDQD